MYHLFKYILLLKVKTKGVVFVRKKVIFDIADTVNPIKSI